MKGKDVMGEKTITIEIDEQGNSSLDLTGFQGKGCGRSEERRVGKVCLAV